MNRQLSVLNYLHTWKQCNQNRAQVLFKELSLRGRGDSKSETGLGRLAAYWLPSRVVDRGLPNQARGSQQLKMSLCYHFNQRYLSSTFLLTNDKDPVQKGYFVSNPMHCLSRSPYNVGPSSFGLADQDQEIDMLKPEAQSYNSRLLGALMSRVFSDKKKQTLIFQLEKVT